MKKMHILLLGALPILLLLVISGCGEQGPTSSELTQGELNLSLSKINTASGMIGTSFTAVGFDWGVVDPDLGNCEDQGTGIRRTFVGFCPDDKDVRVDKKGTSHIKRRTVVSPISGDLENIAFNAVVIVISFKITDKGNIVGDGRGHGTISITATWKGLTGTFEGHFKATFMDDFITGKLRARGTGGDFLGMKMKATFEEMPVPGGEEGFILTGQIFESSHR